MWGTRRKCGDGRDVSISRMVFLFVSQSPEGLGVFADQRTKWLRLLKKDSGIATILRCQSGCFANRLQCRFVNLVLPPWKSNLGEIHFALWSTAEPQEVRSPGGFNAHHIDVVTAGIPKLKAMTPEDPVEFAIGHTSRRVIPEPPVSPENI